MPIWLPPKKGTMDAIVQVINDWGEAKDKKEPVTAIFFDFAKAFDVVDHEVLLTKIEKVLPLWKCRWIAAYLTNRMQRVKVGEIVTEWKPVEAGVIQGSVLGPILFILFIADINEFLPINCCMLKNADDILAYILDKHVDNIPQDIADGVEKWCEMNKMRLNEVKCKVLSISNIKDNSLPVIKLSGKPPEIVESYKYLGTKINKNLDWSEQWQKIQKRIGPVPYLSRQLKLDGFRMEILISVYRSYLLSYIGYSSPALISVTAEIESEMQQKFNRGR